MVAQNLRNTITQAFLRVARGVKHLFDGEEEGHAHSDVHKVITLSQLRPTQIAVGMKQVVLKRWRLRERAGNPKQLEEFILNRPIRVVMGPGDKAYIIDHHHLALALVREGFKKAPVEVAADYSGMTEDEFWKKMQRMKYVYPVDENGVEKTLADIPKSLSEMKDDPYRSLAGFARNAGAFKKDWTPYAEFKWADYFRTRITKTDATRNFDSALKQAIKLANKTDAAHLPGYTGPKPDKQKKNDR